MKVMVRAYDEDQVDVGWFVFRRHEAPIYDDTSDQASGTRRYHEFGQLGEKRGTPICCSEAAKQLAHLFQRSLVDPLWQVLKLRFLNLAPKGQRHASPGRRPGNRIAC